MSEATSANYALRIQARLLEHIDAKIGVLEPSQVSAALGLLKKYVPDLQAITHKGDADAPLVIVTRAE